MDGINKDKDSDYNGWLIRGVLRHINPCMFFNAKSCSHIHIKYI